MKEEKLLTKHPLGKSGKNISRQYYETMKLAITHALEKNDLTHTELMHQLKENLKDKFEGSIGWYAETVKLHLEAIEIIERTSEKPPRYKLK